jgi:hypothetical protein
MAEPNEMSLPAACRALGKSWPQVWRLLLQGVLEGRLVNGRWRIRRSSVERVRRLRQQTQTGSAA